MEVSFVDDKTENSIMDEEVKVPKWIVKFILSDYFSYKNGEENDVLKNPCSCDRKECTKYFCISCETGKVCERVHSKLRTCSNDGSKYLQVRKVTHRTAIDFDELKRYCGESLLRGIQTYRFNNKENIILQSKDQPDLLGMEQSENQKAIIEEHCQICRRSIKTCTPNYGAIYCSLQCRLSVLKGFGGIRDLIKDERRKKLKEKNINFIKGVPRKFRSLNSKPSEEVLDAAAILVSMGTSKISDEEKLQLQSKVKALKFFKN
ncbi:hypothetical protein M758_8G175000 [Ceratodon purpureus]|nr:hypothetical protein M758_8G175000 [Ceratodon purpureus]